MKTLVVFSLFVVILVSFWAESVQAQTPVAVNMVALPKERVVPGGWVNEFDVTMTAVGARSVKVDIFWQDGLEFRRFYIDPWNFQEPLYDWRVTPGPPYGISFGIASGAGKKVDGVFRIGTLHLKVPKALKGTKFSIGLVAAFDDTLSPAVQNCEITIAESNVLPGDPTGDTRVSMRDVMWVVDYVTGAINKNTVQMWQYFAADVSGNGKLDTYDARLILQKYIGTIAYFPVEDYQGSGGIGIPVPLGSVRGPAVLNLIQKGSDLVEVRFDSKNVRNGELALRLPAGVTVSEGTNIGLSRLVQSAGEAKLVFVNGQPVTNAVLTLHGKNALEAKIEGTVDDGVPVVTKIAENTVTEIESEGVPQKFVLEQNYPNPFNPSTTIAFTLAKAGTVSLKIYDVFGREVITLIQGERPAGKYSVVFKADGLSSGTYFYTLRTSEAVEVKRMILLK